MRTLDVRALIPSNLPAEERRRAEANLTAWLAQGYRESRRCPCLTSLVGRRCAGVHARHGAWYDHVTLWTQGGRPVALTSQPYELSLEAEATLLEACHRQGLTYHIDPARSWWCPGGTTWIVVRRRG